MRPIEVRMINFGPFRDERVDFTQLDEIFLLCGDTGAGKTTVFDAMCFALYGQLLGARKGHARDAVCEFAPPDEEAAVVFTFAICESQWRVRRTLPREVLNKRGKMVDKDSTVALEVRRGEESPFEPVLGGKREIDERLGSLIGLSYEQFTKVVILPQGDFADFLRAKSKEKTDILKKIFPIDFYERVSSLAKERADEAKLKLAANEQGLKEATREGNFDTFDEDMAILQGEIVTKQSEQQSILSQRESVASEVSRLEERLQDAKMRDEAKAALAKLVAQKDEVQQKEHAIAQAQNAAKVKPYDEAFRQVTGEVRSLDERLKTLEAKRLSFAKSLDTLEEQSEAMASWEETIGQKKVDLEEARRQVDILRQAESAAAALKDAQGRLAAAQRRASELEERTRQTQSQLKQRASQVLPLDEDEPMSAAQVVLKLTVERGEVLRRKGDADRVLEAARKADSLRTRVANAHNKADDKRHQIDEATKQHEAVAAILADFETQKRYSDDSEMACHLAAGLKEGKPCCVCGSTSHPAPAHGATQSLGIEEKIASQKIALQDCEQKVQRLKEELASIETQLTSFEEQLAEMGDSSSPEEAERAAAEAGEVLRRVEAALSDCQRLQNESERQEAERTKLTESIQQREREVEARKAELNTLRQQAGEQGDIAAVSEQITRLTHQISTDEKECAAFKRNLEQARTSLAQTQAALNEAHTSRTTATERQEAATRSLDEALVSAGFATSQEARQWFLSDDKVAAIKEEVDGFYDRMATLTAEVKAREGKTIESQSAISRDLAQKKAELSSLVDRHAKNDATLRQLQERATRLSSSHDRYVQLLHERDILEESSTPLIALSDALAGKNTKKLKFETWFLGVYFADVVESANSYFAKISSGRYEFKLDTGSSGGGLQGLDLLVCDWQNASERSTETLSGGETFMASISLALGLTQVINAGSSSLDSLFIDEGFGSLDKNALDTAVAILQQVGEGRIVGVISHVEEMKAAIPSRVEVVKTPQGSHIRQ